MTPQEALVAHLKTRPETPRPLPPLESPAYQKWRKAMDEWLERKAKLTRDLEVPVLDFDRQNPSVVPASTETYIPYLRGRRRAPKGMK